MNSLLSSLRIFFVIRQAFSLDTGFTIRRKPDIDTVTELEVVAIKTKESFLKVVHIIFEFCSFLFRLKKFFFEVGFRFFKAANSVIESAL